MDVIRQQANHIILLGWAHEPTWTYRPSDVPASPQMSLTCTLACCCPPRRYENSLSGTIPDSWQYSQLEELLLNYNLLSLAAAGSLPLPPTLTTFGISNNPLYGSFPASLHNLTSLRSLGISQCGLRGSLPALPLPPLLEEMWLNENSLTGAVPWDAWGLPDRLASLDVSHNRLSGPLPTGTALPDSMIIFAVSNNELTGTLPAELLEIVPSNLEWFGASDNRLTGTLPHTLILPANRSTNIMHTIELSNNSFSGPVPTDWGVLPDEASNTSFKLGLSGNGLSGTLPADAFLQWPGVIDLRFNRLTGATVGCMAAC